MTEQGDRAGYDVVPKTSSVVDICKPSFFPEGLLLIPLKMVDSLAEQLWTHFFAHWKMLLMILGVGGICYFLSTIELLYPGKFEHNSL